MDDKTLHTDTQRQTQRDGHLTSHIPSLQKWRHISPTWNCQQTVCACL